MPFARAAWRPGPLAALPLSPPGGLECGMSGALRGVEVVSLDLNGTLVTRGYADYFWLELVPRAYAERWGLGLEEARRAVAAEYDRVGPGDLRWYLPEFWARRLGLDVDVGELVREAASRAEVYPDVPEALERLAEGFRLVVASNMPRGFAEAVVERVEEAVGRRVFEGCFSCVSDLGIPRKEPAFYRYVCAEVGAPPARVLHVGDDVRYDYEAPLAAGLRACLVDRSGELGAAGVVAVRSLAELADLIAE